MNHIENLITTCTHSIHFVLLSNDKSNEEKRDVVNNIISNNELPLSIEQILLAFKKVFNWIESFTMTCVNLKNLVRIRLFIFDKLLIINKNMYIAMILALCNKFNPYDMWFFLKFKNGEACDIGISHYWPKERIQKYYELLDYYEFDVSDMKCISDGDKQLIQTYRAEKYAGKSIKCAIK